MESAQLLRVPSSDGPYPLESIKMTLVVKAVAGGFLQPMRSFFERMKLVWGNVPTACARMHADVPVIELGRKFFTENVRSLDHAADIVMHEIMHHLFGHLCPKFNEMLKAKGYTDDEINFAEDAIINAYLHSVGCAGFMESFYPSDGRYGFLRPNSVWSRMSSLVFVHDVEALNFDSNVFKTVMMHEMAHTAFGVGDGTTDIEVVSAHYDSHDGPGSHQVECLDQSGSMRDEVARPRREKLEEAAPPEAKERTGPECYTFYSNLYKLGVTLDQALEFFKQMKPEENEKQLPFLGSHGGTTHGGTAGEPISGNAQETVAVARQPGEQEVPGKLFGDQEAADILRTLGSKAVSRKTKNNFERIINQIKDAARSDGSFRDGFVETKRMPIKLAARDLFNVERNRMNFRRAQFRRRKFSVMLDVSGSVLAYVPFVVGLVKSLRASDYEVDCYCWADRVVKVDLDKVGDGLGIGYSTNGEAVARQIADDELTNVVIITDNEAGALTTTIKAKVYLCLFPGSTETGSFMERNRVPRCQVNHLEVEGA